MTSDAAGAPAPFAISCLDLGKRYGARRAVEHLSFQVNWGEIFALLGPDGAGKTTSLRLLAGILAPSAGTAQVGGVDVRARPEAIKNFIGYMPQNFGLYLDLKVLENIHFYADIYGVSRKDRDWRIPRLLAATGMAEFTGRRAGALSGGMKQKLTLCCALIHVPKILLLDEPTLGVDPMSRREFWKILYSLLREGVTIVVATSYMDEAQRAGRVALLESGLILACDRPEHIIGGIDQTLYEITCEEPSQVRSLAQSLCPQAMVTLYGGAVHVMCPPGTVGPEEIRKRLAEARLVVQDIRVAPPSLEDAFIYLVRASQAGGGAGA